MAYRLQRWVFFVANMQLFERCQGPLGTGVSEGGEAGVADLILGEAEEGDLSQGPLGAGVSEGGEGGSGN